MARKKRAQVKVNRTKTKPKQAKKQQQVTLLGQALRSLGGLGGGAIGTVFGSPGVGSSVGSSLGAAMSKWLGSGDYSVSSNSIVSKASSGIPMMHKTEQSIVVRHKEFLCEVVSSQAFAVQRSFQVNPGLVSTFPWLSRLANSFQEYTVKGMVFHYVPSSGSAVASTNNALGTVMLQTSYRSNDTAPSNKVELLNEFWSNEAMPCEAFAHPIECNPKENPFNIQYVRSDPVPTGDNILLYDLATTHLATSGMQASGITLGDLWVSYEVELKKPIVNSNVTSALSWAAQFTNSASPTAASLFGATTTTNVGNVQLLLSANTITLPVGVFGTFTFYVTLFNAGGMGATSMLAAPALTGCFATTLVNSGGALLTTQAINSSGCVVGCYGFAVTKTNRDAIATVVLPTATLVTAPTTVWLNMFGNTDL